MNMFAKLDESSSMAVQDIKETKCYGKMDTGMHALMWKQFTIHIHILRGV